jgi:D-glycerate 3-kinase
MSVIEAVNLYISQHRIHGKITVVGIGACQGAGKTTLVRNLKSKNPNLLIQTISFDDYYYTPDTKNKLLSSRGLPGTHDIKLLKAHVNDIQAGHVVDLRQYDKSLNNGKGGIIASVKSIKKPDLLLIEGWCLGFQPIEGLKAQNLDEYTQKLQCSKQDLLEVNDLIYDYSFDFDLLIYIKPNDLNFIYKWRLQQEQDMIKQTKMGMSESEVYQFVDRFMPFYTLYSNLLKIDKTLELSIDFNRVIVYF